MQRRAFQAGLSFIMSAVVVVGGAPSLAAADPGARTMAAAAAGYSGDPVWAPPANAASSNVPQSNAPTSPLQVRNARTLNAGTSKQSGPSAAVTSTQRAPSGTVVGAPGLGALPSLGARYYDPTIGRFSQYDPTGQEGSPYAYAQGNPIALVDPDGTAAFLAPLALLAVRAIAGAVTKQLGKSAGQAAARGAVRTVGSFGGRGRINRSLGQNSAATVRGMNTGPIRLGSSTRVGTQDRENAFRVGGWHYFLTGPKY